MPSSLADIDRILDASTLQLYDQLAFLHVLHLLCWLVCCLATFAFRSPENLSILDRLANAAHDLRSIVNII
jgi:hypothetical protein